MKMKMKIFNEICLSIQLPSNITYVLVLTFSSSHLFMSTHLMLLEKIIISWVNYDGIKEITFFQNVQLDNPKPQTLNP
jgi:hypothetical protein